MFGSFFYGMSIGLGLLLPFAVGAASFTILQTSVNKGFYSGMQLAIGISLSDILLMALCYFGLNQFANDETFKIISGFAGAGLLLLFGIYAFRKKNISSTAKQKELKLKINWLGVFSEIGKGFGLNFLNPFLWILWVGIISNGTKGQNNISAISFMAGIAVMLFATDLFKAFFANRITVFLSPKVLIIINKVAGVVLMLGGVVLLVHTCIEYKVYALF
jgi:threonine/homoserine/homoserine lactone efflux protein